MSEIGEQVAVDAVAKGNEDCWYCKQAAPKECVNDEDENPPSDDTDPDSVQENDVKNDSSALGSTISPRPVWDIPLPGQAGKKTSAAPAAHHLLPGNASLKQATDLHGALLFRLAENVGAILRTRAGPRSFARRGFTMLTFIRPENWVRL